MSSEVQLFLETLFAGELDGLFILIWTLQDKKSNWFQKVNDAILFVESAGPQDIYVGTGFSLRDHGPYNRCKSEEIAGFVGVFADIDLRSDAHPNTPLPSTIEEALSILPLDLPPTFVVFTGNGIHVWWLFREPWIFQNDEYRKEGAVLSKRWNTMVSDNGRMKGWKIERLGDLARVLRIPGTTNCKDAANPKNVVIHVRSDHRYNPSDLVEFLDDLGVSDEDAEECARKQWDERFQGKSLVIDLMAGIPEAQIAKWSESDTRFKNTWFRHRRDLPDQSQSGYDLALANFGFRAGLTEQQIINLIIHHRRIHRQKSRTKLDYFYRTLSKATRHCETIFQSDPPSEPGSCGAEMPEPNPSLTPTPRSDREKIQLCKVISSTLGVEILRIVKLSGKEPLYRMELPEGAIEFTGVGKLISQKCVREGIAARVGALIQKQKTNVWDEIAQSMLDACIVEDGGEEFEAEGAARLEIGQYLTATGFIPGIDGQAPQDLRKPVIRHDQIAVCASDLLIFLVKAKSQNISILEVVGMLSAVGAKIERVRGKSFKEQSRWILPLDDFDPADYPSSESGGPTQHG